jgi:tRNA pseudouridine38-40 synthase
MSIMKYERYQFLCDFAYRGELFHGVQEQKGYKTVLGTLRDRIEQAFEQQAYCLFVAARTDKGVHALHNCATFYVKKPLDFISAINKTQVHRNDGLYAVKIKLVDKHTHARNSLGKIYRYTIIDDCLYPEQFNHPYAWPIALSLSIGRMKEASAYLVGLKDFSSLRGGGCQAGSTIKEVFYIYIDRMKNNVIIIEIAGKSFLRKMVRNMVGLLIEIGAGLRSPTVMPEILAAKNRQKAGIMAPACGLMLVKVIYLTVPDGL